MIPSAVPSEFQYGDSSVYMQQHEALCLCVHRRPPNVWRKRREYADLRLRGNCIWFCFVFWGPYLVVFKVTPGGVEKIKFSVWRVKPRYPLNYISSPAFGSYQEMGQKLWNGALRPCAGHMRAVRAASGLVRLLHGRKALCPVLIYLFWF